MEYKFHVCNSNRNTKPKQIHQMQTKTQTDNNILAEVGLSAGLPGSVLPPLACIQNNPKTFVYVACCGLIWLWQEHIIFFLPPPLGPQYIHF